jgi:hypothetical protein
MKRVTQECDSATRNQRHRQKDAKKLMQLDPGQKDQVCAAGAEIHQDRRKVIPFNGIPPKAEAPTHHPRSSFLPRIAANPYHVTWKSMNSLGRAEHPGDAYPSLPDAAVTRNPCMALQPVTRSGGNRPIRREQYAIGYNALGAKSWCLRMNAPSQSVLPRIDKEADDGRFAKRLSGLQPVQTLNEYEAGAVHPY